MRDSQQVRFKKSEHTWVVDLRDIVTVMERRSLLESGRVSHFSTPSDMTCKDGHLREIITLLSVFCHPFSCFE